MHLNFYNNIIDELLSVFEYEMHTLGECHLRGVQDILENLASVHCRKTQFNSLYYLQDLMIQVISGTLGLTDFSPILLVNSPEMYLLYWLRGVLSPFSTSTVSKCSRNSEYTVRFATLRLKWKTTFAMITSVIIYKRTKS